ncbi:MAG: M23 family peptidase, partial [Burkholderiaceae bacterium]|nr:M23 family peptidase [Burkholderiaceae bacterium]
MGHLALPAWGRDSKTALPPPPTVWPQALAVPGGVVRLSLGTAAKRPVAHLRTGDVDVPVLVLGDPIEWTAVVGIALAAPL